MRTSSHSPSTAYASAAAYRPIGDSASAAPALDRPARVVGRALPVAREDPRLDRPDRPSPAPGRRVLQALAITLRGAGEPVAAVRARHQRATTRRRRPRFPSASAASGAHRARPADGLTVLVALARAAARSSSQSAIGPRIGVPSREKFGYAPPSAARPLQSTAARARTPEEAAHDFVLRICQKRY